MRKKEHDIFIKAIEVPPIVQEKADAAFSQIKMEGMDIMERKENYNIKKNGKKRHRFISPAAAAVCVCMLLLGSMTAAAAAYHYLSRGMQGNIQATPKQQIELIDSGVATILSEDDGWDSMASASGNITIKPLEIIADRYFVHLSFSVEGYEIDDMAEPCFEYVSVYTGDSANDENGWVNMPGGSFYDGIVPGIDGKPVYDNGEPIEYAENGDIIRHFKAEDGTLEYVMTIFAPNNENLLGKTVHVEFENLGTAYKAACENASDGTWAFDIPITGNNAAKLYTLDAGLGDSGATLKSVEFSPISIMINYDFHGGTYEEKGLDANGNEITSTFDTEPPAFCGVRLKDGTLLPYFPGGGMMGYTDESRTEYEALLAFDRIIEIGQVDALLFKKAPGPLTAENMYVVEIDN